MRRLKTLYCGETGANAVEFALLLPVFIMLLFGVMYGSALYNTQQTLNQAAREGARYGATYPMSQAPDNAAWASSVGSRVHDILSVDRPLAASPASVCVFFYPENSSSPTVTNGSGCQPPVSGTANAAGPRVVVTATRPSRLEFGLGGFTVPLRGLGIARYEERLDP